MTGSIHPIAAALRRGYPPGRFIPALCLLLLLAACKKEEKPVAKVEVPPAEVTVVKLSAQDVPVTIDFVGQTESSHQVEIRARVNGFLEKRMYEEGTTVTQGQVLFTMDPKPFEAQLNAAKGALAMQEARLRTAQANLKRIRPLTERNALPQKDLDDALGQEQAAAAAVESAQAEIQQATLDLSYTTIKSPVSGMSSFARVQEGAYINPQNSLLTYVTQVDPIWVSFSVTENELLSHRSAMKAGLLQVPDNGGYEVEIVLADGTVVPERGRLTFADAEYSAETGTFMVRAVMPNPGGMMRPGQFVRIRLIGAHRPNAILVPQMAVLQGAQGHFVWVVGEGNKARVQAVEVGPWHGNDWFILSGLKPADQVVVSGMMRLTADAAVKVVETTDQAAMPAKTSAATTATVATATTVAAGEEGRP